MPSSEFWACLIPGKPEHCRKELECSGAFIEPLWEMAAYVAMQPDGTWWAFDSRPVLTDTGWLRQWDQPDQVVISWESTTPPQFNDWRTCLYQNHRYQHRLTKVRRKILVPGAQHED